MALWATEGVTKRSISAPMRGANVWLGEEVRPELPVRAAVGSLQKMVVSVTRMATATPRRTNQIRSEYLFMYIAFIDKENTTLKIIEKSLI